VETGCQGGQGSPRAVEMEDGWMDSSVSEKVNNCSCRTEDYSVLYTVHTNCSLLVNVGVTDTTRFFKN
jgi:hypothetical protein